MFYDIDISHQVFIMLFNEIFQFEIIHFIRISLRDLLSQLFNLNLVRMSIQLSFLNFFVSKIKITKPKLIIIKTVDQSLDFCRLE